MNIVKNYDLVNLNTFGIHANAKFFVEIQSVQDFKELFQRAGFKGSDKLFLGGGSNVLFTRDFDGIVVLNKLKGIQVLEENDSTVLIKSMSGERWHDLVIFATDRGYWGIENLSFIPGTVGGAPLQNIGAYGAELKDTLIELSAYDVQTGEERIFKNNECHFGYRDSIFKNDLKGKYFIASITLKLSRVAKPNLSYKILKDHVEEKNIDTNNPKNICEAVTKIRQSKLPDPTVIPNAGSFFKNIILTKNKAEEFLLTYPGAPSFAEDDLVKIPSAWLIEECGWKGKRVGNVGVHARQALVVVNYGGASGKEIRDLVVKIMDSVSSKFGLNLVPEVNII